MSSCDRIGVAPAMDMPEVLKSLLEHSLPWPEKRTGPSSTFRSRLLTRSSFSSFWKDPASLNGAVSSLHPSPTSPYRALAVLRGWSPIFPPALVTRTFQGAK